MQTIALALIPLAAFAIPYLAFGLMLRLAEAICSAPPSKASAPTIRTGGRVFNPPMQPR